MILGDKAKKAIIESYKKNLTHLTLVNTTTNHLDKVLSVSEITGISSDGRNNIKELELAPSSDIYYIRNSVSRGNALTYEVLAKKSGNTWGYNKAYFLTKSGSSWYVTGEISFGNFRPSYDTAVMLSGLQLDVEVR